jgi:uncharacterized membrane protein YoaT (DUF817 family)
MDLWSWFVGGLCLLGLIGLVRFTWNEWLRYRAPLPFLYEKSRNLLRFGLRLLVAALFPLAIFGALAVTKLIAFPVLGLYRYDWLLLGFLAVQAGLVLAKVESGPELRTVCWFHLFGLLMELFKVHVGSWAYPEPAWTKLWGVPLYSGFMYASVASFLLGFWKQLRAEVVGWPRPWLVALVGGAIYLNFFTHHLGPDLRWPLMGIVVVLFWRTRLHLINTELVRVWPLTATFAGLGLLIWVAENLATFLGAWAYPDQGEVWQPVHLGKVSSWALLVIISFILVAERRLHSREAA